MRNLVATGRQVQRRRPAAEAVSTENQSSQGISFGQRGQPSSPLGAQTLARAGQQLTEPIERTAGTET